jgi:Mn2+/Fe2+ NRAMP family transporter
MNPDTARFLASAVVVLCVVAIVLMGAAGCRDFEAYVIAVGVAILAGFIASTQPT